MTEPTDTELDAVLCKHWPAFSMQATLVRMWVRAAMRDAIAKWDTPPAEQPATTKADATTGAALGVEPGAVYAELPAPTASIGTDDAWHEAAMRDFADRTHALRMQAAPKAAPPAFWHVMSKEHGEAFLHTAEGAEHSRQKGHTVTALYTVPAPPTQAQAGAVPLTVSQICEWWASENGLEDCEMCKITDFLRVVRAVEEKHGIKGGLHGAK